MSFNHTPTANRLHIAFFGKTNAGKSSMINAVTGQDIAIVSPVEGTTTDPVYKSMELLPLGPVTMIDTAGLSDTSVLGELRKDKTLDVLNKTDIAVLVVDATETNVKEEKEILHIIQEKGIPILGVINKMDLVTNAEETQAIFEKNLGIPLLPLCAFEKKSINHFKTALAKTTPTEEDKFKIVGDLISPGDMVILVVPIDKSAPKGRLILPQQQTIRDILENDAMAIVTKEVELRETFSKLAAKPKLVITDSQAFLKVAADTPKDILMTSFSILFARYKGDINTLVSGAKKIAHLQDGDEILIAEGCTHHRQSDDIGTVKIPRWLRQLTGKQLNFTHVAGTEFTKDITKYALVVHCGGCMLNQRAMLYRLSIATQYNVSVVNYGILIAYVHGILDRALEPFPLAKMLWNKE